MRILGIDPGSVATGWGVVHHEAGRAVHLAHGVLRPVRGGAMAERLAFLHAGIAEVLQQQVPDLAVVERVFVAMNPRSALVLGQARGVAMASPFGSEAHSHERGQATGTLLYKCEYV